MQYAVIFNSRIENVIEWDGKEPWTPPIGRTTEPLPEGAWIGWVEEGGVWKPPLEGASDA